MTVKINFAKKVPLICVPLTGGTEEELMDQLDVILLERPDVIEWRADFFNGLNRINEVLEMIEKIKLKTTIPLLFTIRAEHEGGEKIQMNEIEKVSLLKTVCKNSSVEMVDFELSNEPIYISELRELCTMNNKQLILSYHNFEMTPCDESLKKQAELAVAYGADVVKLAVMPVDKHDVLRLLNVTKEMDEQIDLPIITMSMGSIGGLSRLMGWAYGSVLTFGVGVEQSAPGQIPIRQLREIIEQTQDIVQGWNDR